MQGTGKDREVAVTDSFRSSTGMPEELPHFIFLVPQSSGHHRLHRRRRHFQPVHCGLPAVGLDRRLPGNVQGNQDVSEGIRVLSSDTRPSARSGKLQMSVCALKV